MLKWLCMPALLAVLSSARPLRAQGNYEIQVYGADTVEPKSTMVELHSNFTPDGQKYQIDGVYPTNHQQHETLEITQGLTSWSEVGFYVFTSWQNGHGVQWVGDHIRPRVRVPDSWHWPVGVSVSTEVGYQRAVLFSRYLDLGDKAHYRQVHGPMVLGGEPGAGTNVARSRYQTGSGFFARGEAQL